MSAAISLYPKDFTFASRSRDDGLVVRARAGDRAAFDMLVRRYRPQILKLSMRYTRNPADAEDAVQITFMKAFRGLSAFRGDSAFYSWLHRIAINSAKTVNELRSRDRSVPLAEDFGEASSGRSSERLELETPEKALLTEEIAWFVNAAIDGLCEEQRTAIVLRELEGLSYADVAREMGCPIGTVRSRVSRARDAIDGKLRRVLDGGLSRARCCPDAGQ